MVVRRDAAAAQQERVGRGGKRCKSKFVREQTMWKFAGLIGEGVQPTGTAAKAVVMCR